MSKILDTGTSKLTFAMLCLKFVFAKLIKQLAKVCLVFIVGSAIHKYIVQVYKHKFVDVIAQHVIHEALECAWGVAQAQRKHSILIQPITCYKSGFWPSARSQSNLVVATSQVKCRKKPFITQLIKKVIYPW